MDELVAATAAKGAIQFLAIAAHMTGSGVTLDWDQGFYRDNQAGSQYRNEDSRNAAARDVTDLVKQVRLGTIRFAEGAVLFLAGCKAGQDLPGTANLQQSLALALPKVHVIAADGLVKIHEDGTLTTDGNFYMYKVKMKEIEVKSEFTVTQKVKFLGITIRTKTLTHTEKQTVLESMEKINLGKKLDPSKFDPTQY